MYVGIVRAAAGSCSIARLKALLEIVDNIVNVLETNRNTDKIFCHSRINLFLVAKLLVGGGPWMNGKSFCITNTTVAVSVLIRNLGRITYFARFDTSLKPSTTWDPAAAPPFTPNESTPPNPLGRYFLANSCEA